MKIVEIKADLIFFHNLRFDGSFIVDYLLRIGLICGKDFECIIDGMNIWYQIVLNLVIGKVTIWDSLKKFPGQSVQSISKLYGIEGKKEKPHFERYIEENYKPPIEEIEYCLQDSRIISYALNKEFLEGHTSMTLSSDAFKSVQSTLGGFMNWRSKMPKQSPEQDSFCRESYKGGWVYVNPTFRNETLDDITVYDVNSLYPHVMRNTELPWGNGIFSDKMPTSDKYLYVVRFSANFELRNNFLPTVQIKNNPFYKETEYLTECWDNPILCMTNIDYKLFKTHYKVYDEDIHRVLVFKKRVGLLKDYIDYWTSVKIQATKDGDEARRYIAKRYLNSPYGKTGMRPDRINKIAELNDIGEVTFTPIQENVDGIYVPYASFVCAQARNITITNAQKHYKDFIYADTDSLHLIGDDHSGLNVDNYKLGYWKVEGKFEKGKYIRPKTYIHADNNYNVQEIKCAGMPDNIKEKCTWDLFREKQEFEGKLMQKRVPGGVVLVSTTYKIKEMLY